MQVSVHWQPRHSGKCFPMPKLCGHAGRAHKKMHQKEKTVTEKVIAKSTL